MTLLSGDISKNVITNQLEMKIITETEAFFIQSIDLNFKRAEMIVKYHLKIYGA